MPPVEAEARPSAVVVGAGVMTRTQVIRAILVFFSPGMASVGISAILAAMPWPLPGAVRAAWMAIVLGMAGVVALVVVPTILSTRKTRVLFETPYTVEYSSEGIRSIVPAARHDVFLPWSTFSLCREISSGFVLLGGRLLLYHPYADFSGPYDVDRIRAFIAANVRRVRFRKPKHDVWAPQGAPPLPPVGGPGTVSAPPLVGTVAGGGTCIKTPRARRQPMADARETMLEEAARLESRQETGGTAGEEGLSPEVRQKMEAGRARNEQLTGTLRLEQEGNAALGEPMAGDVAGLAIEEELESNRRESEEAGLSPEVRARMADGRARAEGLAANLAAEQNESDALGDTMPGDVAGEGLGGHTTPEEHEAAQRAAGNR
ncbi:MAG: hypothetical protein ACRDJO_08245 [Actinomycetota bacterium]